MKLKISLALAEKSVRDIYWFVRAKENNTENTDSNVKNL